MKQARSKAKENSIRKLHDVQRLTKKIDQTCWGEHVRRMELCIGRGDNAAAHRALDDFLDVHAPEPLRMDDSVWTLCGPVAFRVLTSLEANGYRTIADLLQADDAELCESSSLIGVKTVADIRQAIEVRSLRRYDPVAD